MLSQIKPIKVAIDFKEIEVLPKTTILQAAKRLNIHIPTLCHHEDLCISGSCRMCLVEIEGSNKLHTACSYQITEPITVKTHSLKISLVRTGIIKLLFTEHAAECCACGRNLNCELQALAAEYGIKQFTYGHMQKPQHQIDKNNPIVYDKNKCFLCGRCVRTCNELQGIAAIGFANRGKTTAIQAFGAKPIGQNPCISCGQCINRCPTAALSERDDTKKLKEDIEDQTRHVVIQTSPAVRIAIGECFGLAPGHGFTFQLNTALRLIGFDKVFDTCFATDLNIIEQSTEFLLRLYNTMVGKDPNVVIPQFISCSPGAMTFIKNNYPEFLPNLSTTKNPQQMFGAIIKSYYAAKSKIDPRDITSVALVSCTAKKLEVDKPQIQQLGTKDLDYVLTTREIAGMIKEYGIRLQELPNLEFDEPFGTATGSGVLSGVTGGMMEAVLRTIVELVTGLKVENIFDYTGVVPIRGLESIRYIELPIKEVGQVPNFLKSIFPNWDWLKGITIKAAITHGTANIKRVLTDIKTAKKFNDYHLIEFMACPGGCLGGGGQPIPTNAEIRRKRAKAIYNEEVTYEVRKSHENPAVIEFYKEILTDGPCGVIAHELLHTRRTKNMRP